MKRHFKKILFCVIFFSVFGFAKNSKAATYYIDYDSGADTNNGIATSTPWKLCPGMTGFAGSYSHSAGDTFVFKGGVTWPYTVLPFTINYSGTSGHVDTYTADQTWYTGASWSYPIIDGNMSGGANSDSPIIYTPNAQSYLKIDHLQLQNIGNATTGSGTAIQLVGGSNIEISNCWLQPEAVQAFAYTSQSNGLMTGHIYIHDNFIRRAGRGVVYGWEGDIVNDVQVYNNDWQGRGDTDISSYHGDGLMIGNPDGNSCSASKTATVTNVLFHNNKFYGNWDTGATAFLYSNGCSSNVSIYDNVFAYENTGWLSPAMVDFAGFGYDSNIYVYNNTFSSDANPGYPIGAGCHIGFASGATTSGNLDVRNNIFSGFAIDIAYSPDASPSVTMDYNLHHPSTVGGYGYLIAKNTTYYNTLAAVQAQGFETHSPAVADPKFVAIPNGTTGSGNWQLQSSSPAINNGANLSSIFTNDLLGNTRSGAWDIGAYEYSSGTIDTTPPAAPSGLSVS